VTPDPPGKRAHDLIADLIHETASFLARYDAQRDPDAREGAADGTSGADKELGLEFGSGATKDEGSGFADSTGPSGHALQAALDDNEASGDADLDAAAADSSTGSDWSDSSDNGSGGDASESNY
jgi:hypothetical protein